MAVVVLPQSYWKEINPTPLMQYGICHLSVVPVKSIADDTAALVTQLLYG